MPFSAPFWSPSEASAILFDWDGVIAETDLDFSEIRKKYYGGRRAMLIEDAFTLTENQRLELHRDLEQVEMEGAISAEPVSGIRDILSWVDGSNIPWAVVSRNCRKSIILSAERICVTLPEIVRARDDGAYLKPDPRALTEVCNELCAEPNQTLFIGDFIYDMIGARRAGMRGVLVRSSIEPDWSPWLECTYTSMHALYRELLSPSEIVPWEYQEVVERHGRDFLQMTAGLEAEIPINATPDIVTWLTKAASLGLATFIAPDIPLSPKIWKKNPSFDPAEMGIDISSVIRRFIESRYPLAKILKLNTGINKPSVSLPAVAGELEHSLLALQEGKEGR